MYCIRLKVAPYDANAGRGKADVSSTHLDLGASKGYVVRATPRPPYSKERDPVPIVHEAGWVQDRSGRVRKTTPPPPPPPGFEPRTDQPVASRCTDCSVPAIMFGVRTNARKARYTASHVCHRQHVELDCMAGRQLTQCTAQVAVVLAV